MTNKTKLSWFTYITDHLLRAWVQQWSYNFRMWADLMTNNYEGYATLEADDPEQECREWFWASLNMDDIYTKEFLEELYRRISDIASGKEKTYPLDDVLEIWSEDAQKYYDE
jgi:hypothetical protein